MPDFYISFRNKITRFLYKVIFKPIAFRKDPEEVHDKITAVGVFLGSHFWTRKVTEFLFFYRNKTLEQNILGIDFENPVGLSAGFDKNAELPQILPAVGFGFAELGSITGEPCPGNPKPRLWRLEKSEALVVNYGLKNDGCKKISAKLRGQKFKIPIGISIAKTNSQKTVETEAGIADYVKAARAFTDIGDYLTINISCPNAYGGQPFTDPVKLDKLLLEIDKIKFSKPVFLKISPDLADGEINQIIEVADKHRVDGFVCSNLTKKRTSKIVDSAVPEKGGISGRVVTNLSDKLIGYIYKKTKGQYIIIGVGGILSAEDAYRKIRLGASLVQIITGMVFKGPQIIGEINYGLVRLIKKDGFGNIAEAIGADFKKIQSLGQKTSYPEQKMALIKA